MCPLCGQMIYNPSYSEHGYPVNLRVRVEWLAHEGPNGYRGISTLWTGEKMLGLTATGTGTPVQGAQVVGRVALLLRLVGRDPNGASLADIVRDCGLTRRTSRRGSAILPTTCAPC